MLGNSSETKVQQQQQQVNNNANTITYDELWFAFETQEWSEYVCSNVTSGAG